MNRIVWALCKVHSWELFPCFLRQIKQKSQKCKTFKFLNYKEECLTKLITVHLPFTFWWINGGSFLSYLWSQVILSTFMYESALNFFFENEREIRLGKGLKVKNQFFILLISPKWRACLRMMKRWKKKGFKSFCRDRKLSFLCFPS